MTWYYPSPGGDLIPFVEEEVPEMLRTGCLTGDTLVWREGLTDWIQCRAVWTDRFPTLPRPVPVPPPSPSAAQQIPGTVLCSSCGAENADQQSVCWLCGRMFRTRPSPAAGAAQTHHPIPPPPQHLPLLTRRPTPDSGPCWGLIFATTILVVIAGVGLSDPGLGFLLVIVFSPGFLFCLVEASRPTHKRRSGDKVLGSTLLMTASSAAILTLLACVAGFIMLATAFLAVVEAFLTLCTKTVGGG